MSCGIFVRTVCITRKLCDANAAEPYYDLVCTSLKERRSYCSISGSLCYISEATEDFDLNFPSNAIDSYIFFDNNVPEMNSMTILFWINTYEARKMTVLSYAVEGSAGELRLSVKRDEIIIQSKSLKDL